MAERKKSTAAVKAKSPVKKKKKTSAAKSGSASKKTSAAAKSKASVMKRAAAKSDSTSKKKPTAGKKAQKKLNGSKIMITGDERHNMICEAAYLVSLKRDPDACNPQMDWVHAETVIDMIFEVS